MSNQRSYYQPKFLREMQLGLVVYGGVSLAIYTHGICQEFYHAVRGRGIYKLVKALTDADLVVDTISGSSAGGINGILLAYAIANSNEREIVDFSSFARIWRNSGDLLKLLQKPNLFKSPVSGASFSWENFYHRELLATSIRAVEYKLPRSHHEWFSKTKELDLAIAATDYLGKTARSSNEIRSKNHQALFLLKHRQGRKEPFNPYFKDPNLSRSSNDTYQALVKLCQITAGTPVIFPLVEVDLHDRQNLIDRQLVTWGRLAKQYSPDLPTDRSDKLYFLDGGLLDNSPLTCLRKEAYYRLSNRASQRKLFYVDPNPENLHDRMQVAGKKQSRTGQILQAAALSLPIHQSITNDLRAIDEHNHKVRRYQSLIDRTEMALDDRPMLESADRTQAEIYLRGRLFDFRDRNLPLLLKTDLDSQNTQYSAVLDKIDRILVSKFTNGQDRHNYYKLIGRFQSQTIDLDVEYSLRQHLYIIEQIGNLLKSSKIEDNVRDRLQCLLTQLSCNVKLLEVIRSSIELLLSDRAVNNYFYFLINEESIDLRIQALVYEFMFRLHRFILDGTRFQTFIPSNASGANLETIAVYFWLDLPEVAAQSGQTRWLSQTRISSVFAQLKQRIAELQQSNDLRRLIWVDRQLEDDRDRDRSFPSILKQIGLATEALLQKWGDIYTDRLLKQWHTFEVVDRELYPFEYLTSLHEKEIINPICISPDTAQLGIGNGKSTQEKLGGDKLYNIGGFFKKSWRANDLLWGRLDGLNRIVEGVITPKSVTAFAHFVRREVERTNSSQSQYLDWLITESLPHLSGTERQTIERHLERLAQPGLRIERAELQKILADLVLAGQREILTSDVHSVIEGMDEQPGWWRLAVEDRQTDNWILSGKNSTALPTSNPNTIARIVHQSLANLAAQQRNFFRNQYQIRVNRLWENMPLVNAIGICIKFILFLRNVLAKIFQISSNTQSLRHPIYRLLDGTLQSIHWWLQGSNVKPQIILFQLVAITAATIGAILTLLHSPLWLILSLASTIFCLWLQTLRLKRLKRLNSARSTPFLPTRK